MQRSTTRLSFISLSLVTLLSALSAAGCDSEKKESAPSAEAAEAAEKSDAPTEKSDAPAEKAEGAKVTVTKEGGKIDPPVKPSAIPDGAWMCKMGTVHYASLDKGDGKCPICGMNLTEQTNGSDNHEGHDH